MAYVSNRIQQQIPDAPIQIWTDMACWFKFIHPNLQNINDVFIQIWRDTSCMHPYIHTLSIQIWTHIPKVSVVIGTDILEVSI